MADIESNYRLVPYVSPSGKKPVQQYIDDLEAAEPEAAVVFYDLIVPLVKTYGGALGMPHFKHLPPTDFSEIRWDGRDKAHHRIYCSLERNGAILLLHAVTKRWPKFDGADTEICRQRYSDYCSKEYDPQKRQRRRE